MIFGIGISLYPVFYGMYIDDRTKEAIDIFYCNNKVIKDKETSDKVNEKDVYDALYRLMLKYNIKLYNEKQAGLRDPWSFEKNNIKYEDYGIYDGMIANIVIPDIDVNLPVYAGATEENFLKGAAHLSNTSFPIGGVNTNCVIAAHRGYNGGKYFRDIENLKKGSHVYITNPWETIDYVVKNISIVYPGEIDAIKIKKNKDILTLMTCHPYIGHTYRYLVYCERYDINKDLTCKDKDLAENNKKYINSSKGIKFVSSESQIFIDKWIPVLFTVLALVVVSTCIYYLRK